MNRFQQTLARHGLTLSRERTTTLQVNVGRLCNLACRHCHLEAGPGRAEVMSPATMAEVEAFARRHFFQVIDITGGAPELVPGITSFVDRLADLAPRLMLRTNLLLLLAPEHRNLLDLCRQRRAVLVASFPATNPAQTESQRGSGVWTPCLEALRELNRLGYGRPGTGLELNLVANPAGAFLPPDQCAAEHKFKEDLARKWGIEFNHLFTLANVPLGRFKNWLQGSGNYDAYLARLTDSFNPGAVPQLMCRSLISVAWDGALYDCDFNLAAGLPFSGSPVQAAMLPDLPPGAPVMTGDYCFACTAGSGFT